jgi:hypothetical protein
MERVISELLQQIPTRKPSQGTPLSLIQLAGQTRPAFVNRPVQTAYQHRVIAVRARP